jgi:exosortase
MSKRELLPLCVLGIGLAALAIPTLVQIAKVSWSTEQGAHGPIVLATGIWLIIRDFAATRVSARPGLRWVTALITIPLAALYVLSHVTGLIEIEGVALYGLLITTAYALFGPLVLGRLWFPILYLGFIFPPPNSLVTAVTQPLKVGLSKFAAWLLYQTGLPIASSGVMIYIAQYQLFVAQACSGLNSLISLTAIGLFYVYIRHSLQWRYAVVLALGILPIAIAANLIRVILLILITYWFGDAMAQGFLHNFAGLTMYAVALASVMALDSLLRRLRPFS